MIVNVYVPAVVGVPESVAVPSPLSLNVTPDGSAPVSDNVHVGGRSSDGKGPTIGLTAAAGLTVKVALLGLVIWHAWLTVRVKLWVA